MSLRRPRFQEEEDAQAKNISPLIDVIFILLIFFIVTMSFADSEALKVDAPNSSESEKLEQAAATILIGADSRFVFDSKECDSKELVRRLSSRSAGTKSVVIRADSRVPVDRLVEAMDCAKAAGVENIYVSADRK